MRYTPRPDCQIPGLADIYERYLTRHPGSFVEVGAFDGYTVSNTWPLAEAGWTGLYIEPQPIQVKACRFFHRDHPNIRVAEVGISDHEGRLDLYEIGECSTFVWDKSAVDWGGDPSRKISVGVTTLDKCLEAHQWEVGFDVLVIDVEQHELQVLKGFSVRRWLPRLVIIEAHELDRALERNWKALPIAQYFGANGYTKVYADHINSIFLRQI